MTVNESLPFNTFEILMGSYGIILGFDVSVKFVLFTWGKRPWTTIKTMDEKQRGVNLVISR